MKCHAGVEFESGKPCPKCSAKLGEVCWPGINADLLEVDRLRKESRMHLMLADQRQAKYCDALQEITRLRNALEEVASATQSEATSRLRHLARQALSIPQASRGDEA